MTRHISRAIVLVFCAMSGAASAQVAMGAAKPPGIRISPAPPKPEARIRPPALSEQSVSKGAPSERRESKGRIDHGVREQVSPGEDVFRARPDTYVPRRVRQVYVPYVVTERVVEPILIERTRVVDVEKPAREERATRAESPAVVTPTRVFTPTPPKTLYVITRCYAGDKLPDPSVLPDGCDVRDVRIIRPQ